MASRQCVAQGCANRVNGNANRKYCSHTCRDRESKRRHRSKTSTEIIDPKRVRRGDAYATLENTPTLVTALENGTITQRAAAQTLGISESMFSEAYANFIAAGQLELTANLWVRDPEVDRLLAVGDWDWDGKDDSLEAWLDIAVEAFVEWREGNFSTVRGPYITKKFHRTWMRIILRALFTGQRYLILSPPRHGKSELLIHFCVWLICRNADIRIVWIAANGDLAEDMVGSVKTILEEHTELREAVLGPGVTWQPTGRNKTKWGRKKLTVANRDDPWDNKAPTIRGVGRRGKILSMDVDLLVADDIEDYDSTEGETERGKTRHWWFNSVESRKEEHTAWVTIGSRQHPDDVYDYLLDDGEWESTVDAAHDPNCVIAEGDFDDHISCMLFPEKRSYTWLMSKKRTAEAAGLGGNYEMIYLNMTRPIGLTVFTPDHVNSSKNYRRGFGLEGMREAASKRLEVGVDRVTYHLVGGLDPSATGFQAGFLWAWVGALNKMYCIDASNRRGGGIYPALELMKEWHDKHGLKHWVYEDNNFQAEIATNPDVKAFCQANDIYLEPLTTAGGNRNSPLYGVGAMSNLFDTDMVDLPWGTEEARVLMQQYEQQMLRFVDTASNESPQARTKRKRQKSDILMASWFPQKAIRRFRSEMQADASDDIEEFSYTGWTGTDYEETPW